MSTINYETPETEVQVVITDATVVTSRKISFYQRLTSSMPFLITVMVHVLLIGGAAAIIVQKNVIDKDETFVATNPRESVADKQREYRVQNARQRAGASRPSDPVSVERIISTAENALQMPAMPDLPSMQAVGVPGFGPMGPGMGIDAGKSIATSVNNDSRISPRAFTPIDFLGLNQNVNKVVFVVDTSTGIMEPIKGGFKAFSIIREEIMRLVARLPLGAQFNVILFRDGGGPESIEVNLYKRELSQATSENKKDFFEWMTPVNAKLDNFGPASATRRTGWRRKPLPTDTGVDPLLSPPTWARAAHAALEQGPDTIFIITATEGRVLRNVSEQELTKRRAQMEKIQKEFEQDAKKEGTTPEAINTARHNAYVKVSRELAAANQRLLAAGKEPVVIDSPGSITRPDVQAALSKNGISITVDGTGWTKKDGTKFGIYPTVISNVEVVPWNALTTHISRLQSALVPQRVASLNLYLFVGREDKPYNAVSVLTNIAGKNGGKFQLLTTKRLEAIRAKEAEDDEKGS